MQIIKEGGWDELEPVVWPPRSPDLTPLDFSLWGCKIKLKV